MIKKLLQMQPEKHSDIIKHMAKLTDNIQVGPQLQTAVVSGLRQSQPRDKMTGRFDSDPPPGADGASQHPVADRRILRACAQDRPRCAEEDGQVVYQRRRHCQAANHQSGRQTVSHQLQTGVAPAVFACRRHSNGFIFTNMQCVSFLFFFFFHRPSC